MSLYGIVGLMLAVGMSLCVPWCCVSQDTNRKGDKAIKFIATILTMAAVPMAVAYAGDAIMTGVRELLALHGK
jgi:hypothetical protein